MEVPYEFEASQSVPIDDSKKAAGGKTTVQFCPLTTHSHKKAKWCCLHCGVLMCDKCITGGTHSTHGFPVSSKKIVAELLHRALPLVEQLGPRQKQIGELRDNADKQHHRLEETRQEVTSYFDGIVAATLEIRDSLVKELEAKQRIADAIAKESELMLQLVTPDGLEVLETQNVADALRTFVRLRAYAELTIKQSDATTSLAFRPTTPQQEVIASIQAAQLKEETSETIVPPLQQPSSVDISVKRFGGRGKAEGLFDYIEGMCWGASDTLFVADHLNRRVQEVTFQGKHCLSIPLEDVPRAVAFDSGTNELNVCEKGKAVISVYKNGTMIGPVFAGGQPTRLVIDSQSQRVYALLSSMKIVHLGSSPSVLLSLEPFRKGDFTCYLSIDSQRHRFIYCDYNRHQVHVYDINTTQRLFSLGGEGTTAPFSKPGGAAVDPNTGDIIVADRGNFRLSVWQHNGTFKFNIAMNGKPIAVAIDNKGTRIAVAFVDNFIAVLPLPLNAHNVYSFT